MLTCCFQAEEYSSETRRKISNLIFFFPGIKNQPTKLTEPKKPTKNFHIVMHFSQNQPSTQKMSKTKPTHTLKLKCLWFGGPQKPMWVLYQHCLCSKLCLLLAAVMQNIPRVQQKLLVQPLARLGRE